jgi:hypothetical protein
MQCFVWLRAGKRVAASDMRLKDHNMDVSALLFVAFSCCPGFNYMILPVAAVRLAHHTPACVLTAWIPLVFSGLLARS